jgi:hypothetical protein
MKALQPFPSIALGAFSEELVTSRRVVIFGNALSGLAETLVERGARLVHVYDENPARVAEAAARSTLSQVSFAPLGPGGIAARDGAFDVGFVEEISQFAASATVITRLRRALTARGVALVSTVNPEKKLMYSVAPESADALTLTLASSEKPLSYYDLYDLVTSEFDEVKMVGQTPFVGYALADFSPETDVEFSIDTALVPGGAEEPEFFIAICSHFPITTESFCVVQMAAETLLGPMLSAAAAERSAINLPRTAAPKDALPDTQRLVAQLSETQRLLTSERDARTKAEQLLNSVSSELQHRDAWVAELEKRAATADERADTAEAALERLENKAKQAGRTEDAQAQSRQTELNRQLAALTLARRNLEADLTHANEDRARSQAALAALGVEHDALKTQLEANRAELSRVERLTTSTADLEAKIAVLETQYRAVRDDLQMTLSELDSAEKQLLAQGSEMRRLQTELTDTERFAAVLIAQREARSRGSSDHLGSQGTTCADSAPSDMVAERPGATTSTAAEAAGSEHQVPQGTARGDRASNVSSAPHTFESHTPVAELEATVQALRWTIEELEQRLEATSQEDTLLARLHAAQQQLQRQSVLLRQYENKSPEATQLGH